MGTFKVFENHDGSWGVDDQQGAIIYDSDFESEEQAQWIADKLNANPRIRWDDIEDEFYTVFGEGQAAFVPLVESADHIPDVGEMVTDDTPVSEPDLVAALKEQTAAGLRLLAWQAAESDSLRETNAELRASAYEAQAARLAAVAEAAALRARVEALEAALRPFAEMVEVDDSDGRRFVGASHLHVKALVFAAAAALKGEA